MAKPAKRSTSGESDPEGRSSGTVLLQRWIERPDGRMELLEIPLTPADFLDPQLEERKAGRLNRPPGKPPKRRSGGCAQRSSG
jgi:hypothetical protein